MTDSSTSSSTMEDIKRPEPPAAESKITDTSTCVMDLTLANMEKLTAALLEPSFAYTRLELRYRETESTRSTNYLLLKLFLAISRCPTIGSLSLSFQRETDNVLSQHRGRGMGGVGYGGSPYGDEKQHTLEYVWDEPIPLQLLQVLGHSPHIYQIEDGVLDGCPSCENIELSKYMDYHLRLQVYDRVNLNFIKKITWSIVTVVLAFYRGQLGSGSAYLSSSILQGTRSHAKGSAKNPMLVQIMDFTGVSDEQVHFNLSYDQKGRDVRLDAFKQVAWLQDRACYVTKAALNDYLETGFLRSSNTDPNRELLNKKLLDGMNEGSINRFVQYVGSFVDTRYFRNETRRDIQTTVVHNKRKQI